MAEILDKTLERLIKEAHGKSDRELADSISIPDAFDEDKKGKLDKIFSNLDKPAFLFKHLGILSGAISSMSSRVQENLRKKIEKEIDKNKVFAESLDELNVPDFMDLLGKDFFERVFSEYGDDSIAQMVPIGIGLEGVSMGYAMQLFHHRLLSGIEKSSRYKRYDKKRDGKFQYVVDPLIIQSGLETEFRSGMDETFDLYSKMCNKEDELGKRVLNEIKNRALPFDLFREEVRKNLELKGELPATDDEFERGYKKTIDPMHIDNVRHLLPLATQTVLGLNLNTQNIRDIILRGFSTPTGESIFLTELLHRELSNIIGPLIRDVNPLVEHPEEIEKSKSRERAIAIINYKHETEKVGKLPIENINKEEGRSNLKNERFFNSYLINSRSNLTEIIDPSYGFRVEVSTLDAIIDIAIGIIRERNPSLSFSQIRKYVSEIGKEKIKELVLDYAGINQGLRKNRRHKPGRAFEKIKFDITMKLPIAELRDMRRHRILTNFDPGCFDNKIGFFISPILVNAGLEELVSERYEKLSKLYNLLRDRINPYVASTALPLATNQYMHTEINLRELHHLLELRTQPGAHINYKRVSQMIYAGICDLLPLAEKTLIFVDKSTEIDYGRAIQEIRSVRKNVA